MLDPELALRKQVEELTKEVERLRAEIAALQGEKRPPAKDASDVTRKRAKAH